MIDREDFVAMAMPKVDTTPGPDGLPYSAYKGLGGFGLFLLHDVLLQCLHARTIPVGLAASLAVFLPKG